MALPGHLFGNLRRNGQVLSLFEGIFQRLDAPEYPLVCLTIVRDGIPVNDHGPIYHGGSEKSDTRFRHLFFAEQHAATLIALIHVGSMDDAWMLADYATPEETIPGLYFTDRAIVQMVLRADDGHPFVFAYSQYCPEGELGEFDRDQIGPHRISALAYHTQFYDVPGFSKFVEKWLDARK